MSLFYSNPPGGWAGNFFNSVRVCWLTPWLDWIQSELFTFWLISLPTILWHFSAYIWRIFPSYFLHRYIDISLILKVFNIGQETPLTLQSLTPEAKVWDFTENKPRRFRRFHYENNPKLSRKFDNSSEPQCIMTNGFCNCQNLIQDKW